MPEAQARALAPDLERRERLEYLADLLSELKTLAERERCEKLPVDRAVPGRSDCRIAEGLNFLTINFAEEFGQGAFNDTRLSP